MRIGNCRDRRCNAEIVFLRTAKGSRMPTDIDTLGLDREEIIELDDDTPFDQSAGHKSHFRYVPVPRSIPQRQVDASRCRAVSANEIPEGFDFSRLHRDGIVIIDGIQFSRALFKAFAGVDDMAPIGSVLRVHTREGGVLTFTRVDTESAKVEREALRRRLQIVMQYVRDSKRQPLHATDYAFMDDALRDVIELLGEPL